MAEFNVQEVLKAAFESNREYDNPETSLVVLSEEDSNWASIEMPETLSDPDGDTCTIEFELDTTTDQQIDNIATTLKALRDARKN